MQKETDQRVGVPFADTAGSFAPIRRKLDAAIAEILDSGIFVRGDWTAKLESNFATYVGTKDAAAVSSGTTALALTLRALDVGPGDEVITTALAFVQVAEAICTVGAKPVFADIDPKTLQIDPAQVRALIGPRTVGVVPVHLYGAPAPMDELREVTETAGVWIVEDASQAHGARHRGKRVGSFGIASCFSFHPGRNLGAAGEGGLVASDDEALLERVRSLRHHGSVVKYRHVEVGCNARIGEIEAASVALKLPLLDRANERRRVAASRYRKVLEGLPLTTPEVVPGGEPVHHLFVVMCEGRNSLRAHFDSVGIESELHYPLALHQQPSLRRFASREAPLVHASTATASVLSLPMFPSITKGQIDRVAQTARDHFASRHTVVDVKVSTSLSGG